MPDSPPSNDRIDPPGSSDAASEGLPETPPTFRAIYEGYFDFVWRFAANRGVPPSQLDDAVQEVFVVVHRQLSGFERRSALRTWLAGVTRNVVRSYLRKWGNQSSGEPLGSGQLYASDDLGPAEVLEKKSAGELLDVILDKMTGLQREAFILCEMEGLSPAESAEALYLPEITLRTRSLDARKVFNALSARLRAQRFWVTREGGRPAINELRRHGRQLLDEARRERTPDAAARERVFGALMASAALTSTPGGAAASVEAKLLTGFSKWLVLVGLAGAVAGALYWAGHVGQKPAATRAPEAPAPPPAAAR